MDFNALLDKVIMFIVNPLIGLIFLAGFVLFVWGVVRYFLASQSEEARKTGGRHMLWGIIGMFIMVMVYAILDVIKNTLGL